VADRNVVNPETGEKGSVSDEKFNRARAAGAREMTDHEAVALIDQRKHDTDIVEGFAAEGIGRVRGVGEAFGIPTDELAVGIGGDRARQYLNDLQKYHPIRSGMGELAGQAAGTVAGGELLGGGRAATIPGRIAEAAGRSGLENLVIGTSHDVNETSLGNADLAGEKLLARMPTHFAVGAVAGGVMGGAGEAAGAGLEWFAKKAPGALEHAADAAVGRELGGGAELGAEIRSKMGRVPSSADEITTALRAEQSAFREGSQREAAAAKDALASQHTTSAWQQTAKQEAERLKVTKESKAVLAELASQHKTARTALDEQLGEAASAATKLGEERAAARRQLKNLAADLDKVKGAELPNAQRIMQEATGAFQAGGNSLAPPSESALRLFGEWAENFATRYEKPGSLNFTELQNVIKSLDTMEVRQRVVSGWGSDPEVKRAFDTLKQAAKGEFDRASEATANAVSEAKGLSASRLRDSLPTLDKAHGEALDHVDNLQKSILDFDRATAGEMRAAQREAALQQKSFEKNVRVEDRDLTRAQKAEEKALPKASKETPVDALLGRVRKKEPDAFSPMVAGGALLSLLHGNVAGAAMSAIGGIAAHTAKSKGNLLAARTMSSLAEHIASSDQAIARLAGRAVGRYVRQGAEVATEDRPSRKEVTFEKAVKAVKTARDNPLVIEQSIRSVAGPWAQQAPSVYASMLAAKQRQIEFLTSKLPPERIDPYSLTPHLEKDDLSDTEKYDFVQYYKATVDPMAAMREVIDGKGSPEQVEAVAAVYPGVYKQLCAEVDRQIIALQKPVDYERAVNIGTLLQKDTAEVMTAEFQSMLADMYTARTKEEKTPGGSKPSGVNSRLSKSMESSAQQMQIGDV
jgi:hypothetical protein